MKRFKQINSCYYHTINLLNLIFSKTEYIMAFSREIENNDELYVRSDWVCFALPLCRVIVGMGILFNVC